MLRRGIPIVGCLLFCSLAGHAATYYLDASSGNDSRSGTSPSAAWRTLAKVNGTVFLPGDCLLLRSGSTWTGQLWPKGSGRANHIITLGKYGTGAKPVIHGEGVEDTFLLKNQEYWEVSDLELTNRAAHPAVRRGVHVAGENFGELHHIYLRSLVVHDISGSDRSKENGGIIYTADGRSKPTRFVDLRVENNHIFHSDRNGISGWSSHWPRSSWYPSLGVVVRGNHLEDIGGDGIMIAVTDGAVIEHNVVGHANQRSEGYNIAIWSWSTDNTIIQFNEAYATRSEHDGEGFDSDWNSRNTLIQYNYSHDNQGGFLLICNSGEAGQENIGNIGTIARYNVSQNDHNRGINLAGPIANTQIYNNTIYVGKSQKAEVLLFSDWYGWARDTSISNNIFYVEGEGQISHGIVRDKSTGHHTTAPGPGKSTGNKFDSNVYFGVVPAEDLHPLSSDPLFSDRGHGASGYALLPDSPAIDSGKDLDNSRDFLGTAVPSCAAVDRGAMEFSACGQSKKMKPELPRRKQN